MTGVSPEHPHKGQHALDLQSKANDTSVAFDVCFASLRSFRASLTKAAKSVADVQAPFVALRTEVSQVLDECRAQRTKDSIAQVTSEGAKDQSPRLRAMLSDYENELSSLEIWCSSCPQERQVSQALLTRPTSLPISRLASTMQARDSLEQRISHVLAGYELASISEPATAIEMIKILGAQVESIAEYMTESSETIAQAVDMLDAALQAMFVEAYAIDSLVETASKTKTAALGIADLTTEKSLEDLMRGIANRLDSTVSVNAADNVLHLHAKAQKELVVMLDEMQDEAQTVAEVATGFNDLSKSMVAELPSERSNAQSASIDALKGLYTSEIEHDVHHSAAQRP